MTQKTQEQVQKEAAEKEAQETKKAENAELEALKKENEALKIQLNAEAEKEAKAEKAKIKREEINKEVGDYNRFVELHFIKLDGGELTKDAEKEYKELEKIAKERKGKKPVRTVTAAFGNRTIQLCEGVAVPKEISDFIIEKGHGQYYFG